MTLRSLYGTVATDNHGAAYSGFHRGGGALTYILTFFAKKCMKRNGLSGHGSGHNHDSPMQWGLSDGGFMFLKNCDQSQ